jgi:hypothetical protein
MDVEERFEIKPAYLAADTAYGSADALNWIVNEKKIAPHIPVIDKSKSEDGTFSRASLPDCRACVLKPKCCPNIVMGMTGSAYDD